MRDGPGGDCRAHDFAAVRSPDRASVNDQSDNGINKKAAVTSGLYQLNQ